MIVTKEDLENKFMNCYVCSELLEEGQSYEKITTQRKTEIVVHTNCIGKGVNK
jgi:hypothetical protein